MTTASVPVPHRPRVGAAPGRVVLAGVSVAVLAVVAALSAVAILTSNDAWGIPANADQPVDLVVAVGFSVMGAVVLAGRRHGKRLGWLLLLPGSASAVVGLCAAVASVASETSVGVDVATVVADWLWVFGFLPLVTLLPLSYPDGRLPGPRWRPVAAASVLGMVLLAVVSGLTPDDAGGTVRGLARLLMVPVVVLLVPSVLASLGSLVVRLRRSSGLERRQIAVLLTSAALLGVDLVAQPLLAPAARTPVQAVAVALLPVAIGVAVTRRRLLDLDVVLCRVLLLVSLAACIVGVYLTLNTVLGAVVGPESVLAPTASAAATGLLVHAMALRLSGGADRLLYGDRANPSVVSHRLGVALRDGVSPQDVPRVVEEVVLSALRLRSAVLVPTGASHHDSDPAPSEALDLVHRGDVVGRLLVTPRVGESALDDRDRAVLAAVVARAAPAVASLRAWTALRASRERLVAAREEERLRLRRDLHDGVGAALAGVRLQLESARERVDDPVTARLLETANRGVVESVQDVRRATDDLRPAALDELGLVGSLAALADRATTGRTVVEVTAEPLPELVPAVEVACYRIAAEAVANAVRHAGASTVRVCVAVDGGTLRLEVTDDGRGLPERPRPEGLGLSSMRRRADEIGGRLVVDAVAPTGTRLLAELPVELA